MENKYIIELDKYITKMDPVFGVGLDISDTDFLVEVLKSELPRIGLNVRMHKALCDFMRECFSPLYDSTLLEEFKRMFNIGQIEESIDTDLNVIEVLD